MKIKVDDHLASQAFLALQRVVGADVEDRRRSVDDGQPNNLGQVIRVGAPSPQAHGRSVLLLDRGDVEVIGDAVLADDLPDDLIIPSLERDALEAKVDVEVERGHLGMGELRPPGDVEVEPAGGEAPRRGHLLAVELEREGGGLLLFSVSFFCWVLYLAYPNLLVKKTLLLFLLWKRLTRW
jgi:hypothetical protein